MTAGPAAAAAAVAACGACWLLRCCCCCGRCGDEAMGCSGQALDAARDELMDESTAKVAALLYMTREDRLGVVAVDWRPRDARSDGLERAEDGAGEEEEDSEGPGPSSGCWWWCCCPPSCPGLSLPEGEGETGESGGGAPPRCSAGALEASVVVGTLGPASGTATSQPPGWSRGLRATSMVMCCR